MSTRRPLRQTLAAEQGMTLIETMVAMMLFAIVAAVFTPMIGTALTSATRIENQSQSFDQARQMVLSIQRELRSAECISLPAENTTGTSLRFTTNANNTNYEVTYSVSGSTLNRQVTGQSQTVVSGNLVSTSDAFRQVSTPRRSVVLTFRVKLDNHQTARVLTTTIAGRNAWRTC